MPRSLISGALAAFLFVLTVPAVIQLVRAWRAGDRMRVGIHGIQAFGAVGAAVLLLWWRA